MAAKKGGLGRGLESLFGDSAVLQTPVSIENTEEKNAKMENISSSVASKSEKTSVAKTSSPAAKSSASSSVKSTGSKKQLSAAEDSSEKVVYVSINDIRPNESQPRKSFDEDALNDLSASILEHGVIQPVLLKPSKKGYELVAGERRWRASRLAGLKEIPAIIRDIDDKTNAVYALIENVQRENLNAIEEAEGINKIIEEYGLTQQEAAKLVGKSRSYVTNILRLLNLPTEVIEYVKLGKLSLGHARAIAGLESSDLQLEAAVKAVNEGWSVRQIERYTAKDPAKKKSSGPKSKTKKDAETKAVEERLSSALGTKVLVEGNRNSGRLVVEYYSSEDLDRIIDYLSDK